jgi:3-hydroxybutyryl-CoA dehydrogenase
LRTLVVGAGLMGAQIGVEYALGGHEVALVARDAERARARVDAAFALVEEQGLASPGDVEAARARSSVGSDLEEAAAERDLAVESVPEDLDLKVEVLGVVAAASPRATLATNTSSLSITELGERLGASERTIGTHYWNPPLLMPLVEVIAGNGTPPDLVEAVSETLRALGKRPVHAKDVPGFAWNRLQMAALREAVWLVENGVASPETVDEILTYGLGRRWSNIGFFRAIALGGVDTWERTAANLLPELSAATRIAGLRRWLEPDQAVLAEAAERRDRGLVRDLLEERRQDG